MKKIIKLILWILFFPLKYLVPKGKIIILQTHSPHIYCENTKYLFEYLSRNTSYAVYWVTENREIMEYLDSHGLKYLTNKRIWQKIWISLRGRVVIDTGSAYYNFLNLIGKRTIKISTLHGAGPKVTTAFDQSLGKNLVEVKRMNRFDYVNFPSAYSKVMIGKNNLKIPQSKLITLGYPRAEQFFDENLISEKYSRKKWQKIFRSKVDPSDRCILYTPTWRPYDYGLPLLQMSGFDMAQFDDFLKANNLYFYYTIHTGNMPKGKFPQSEHIQYIDHKKYPLFDINEFMLEVDILFNDYSTTSTEFALLNRPQIFFLPDYEVYFERKGFIEDFRSIMPGKEVCNFGELKTALIECLQNPASYLAAHEATTSLLLQRYYPPSAAKSNENFKKFIESLL